ncbi:response regulator transcription factor [Enterococcus sp. DIV0086]|uniref:response regulator transcription factor n=1 Tax=Enterococcus sp. DIV0086 TaxID=2774655 RepID=UPI003D2DA837
MTNNIVILDDEKEICDLISTLLQCEGFKVVSFYNGIDFIKYIEKNEVSLLILDLMLPDVEGLEILKKIRQNKFFPVLLLTAKNTDLDKIMGLSLGADDYITKPFNPLEVVARIKTNLRRVNLYDSQEQNNQYEIEYNGLIINKNTRKVILLDEEIKVTPIEFEIIYYLLLNIGVVVTSEELFKAVWKESYMDSNNTIMAHIARIREKFHEKPRDPSYIKTVWGVGYTIGK